MNRYLLKSFMLIFRITLFICTTFLIILYLFNDDLNTLVLAMTLFTIHNFIYCLEQLSKRLFLFVFHFTFLIFLVMKPIILLFSDEKLTSSINTNLYFTEASLKGNITIILVSLFSLFITHYLLEKNRKENKNKEKSQNDKNNQIIMGKIKYLAKILIYFCFIPALIVLGEKGLFVKESSFTAYYVEFHSNLPIIVQKINDLFRPIFYIFLATMPTKKEAKIPVILFLLYSLATLSFGQRNEFILNLIILFIYYYSRDKYYESKNEMIKEKWLSLKLKFILVSSVPIMIIFSVIYDYIRRGTSLENFEIINSIKEFFITQGSSNEILSHTISLSDKIPHQKIYYSLGSIYNYISQNFIFSNIFNVKILSENSVDKALFGHSFSSTLTYINYPINYLKGIGMGSSYIAELFFDFGYFGVILGNVVISTVLFGMGKLLFKNWIITFLTLMTLQSLLFIPRASFSDWIVQPVNIINLLLIILIKIYVILINKSKDGYKKNVAKNIIYNK